MWQLLTDNALTAIATLATGLVGAINWRRIASWLSAVKEREAINAAWENEKQWRQYWEAQATQCFDRLNQCE